MPTYHAQLALEYFQARSSADRTEAALAGIVAHVCETYTLSIEATQAVQDEARTLARQRHLLPTDARGGRRTA